MRTFKDLLTSLSSEEDLNSLKKTYGDNFVTTMPLLGADKDEYSQSRKEYENNNYDTYKYLSPQDKKKYFAKNPPPAKNQLRPDLSRALGRFTLEALDNLKNKQNDFQGIKLDSNLGVKEGRAKGLFKPATGSQGRAIYLNPNIKNQDVLSTLAHEGNHALEEYSPYINKIVQSFLNKKLDNKERKLKEPVLPAGYLPNLYKGIQDVINLPDEFTKPYTLDKHQTGTINKNNVNPTDLQGNRLQTSLAGKFNEIPAFALETLMRKDHPWVINENTPNDSRKLLRRIMKEQQQQYRNMGLVDINQPEEKQEGSTRYKYNNARVPIYAPSADRPNYNLVDKAFIDKIEALRKPPERRRFVTQTTTTQPYGNQNLNTQTTTTPNQSYSPYGNIAFPMNNQGYSTRTLSSVNSGFTPSIPTYTGNTTQTPQLLQLGGNPRNTTTSIGQNLIAQNSTVNPNQINYSQNSGKRRRLI